MVDPALGAARLTTGRAAAGRVDLAVAGVAGISRAHAQRLIADGRALVDGRRRRASDRLAGGEEISVVLEPVADVTIEPESIPLEIPYEDPTMIVVDKPAGLVVHPSAGHPTGTLVHALLGHARDRGEPLGSVAGVARPGIVHRLDKDTSGLLVVAKTDGAQAALMRQFADRTIDKRYLALVRGELPAGRGRIEAPVGRHPGDRQRMAVVAGGRDATTEYALLGSGGGYALVELRPLTGRTHQIRAHLAYLGLPIAGDLRYGGGMGPGGLSRQFLHAARLSLHRPLDGARLTVWSALPGDLRAALETSGVTVAPGALPAAGGFDVAESSP